MPTQQRRVLVIGGAGAFGSRLARGLAAAGFDVLIGGRGLDKVAAVASQLKLDFPDRTVEAVAVDRNMVSGDTLRALGLFAVVDAAGPFQGREAPVAEAAIDARTHYVDLADARDFVAAFPRLDARAKAAGVTAVTGASSTPALSHAVLDRLTRGWRTVDEVEIAISPGNRAPRGLSVVESILSYAGRPVRVFLDGEWRTRPGWGMLTRRKFAGLGRRWLSLCETPDLDLIPERFRVRRSAIFYAGLELPLLHLGLAAAALLVRLGLLKSLKPLARPVRAVAGLLDRLGTDRGGMLVDASGTAADGPIEARWTLVAEAGDGPNIPTLPALAILRRLAAGDLPSGAFTCAGRLGLEEIEAEFRPYRILTQVDVRRAENCLFARALGASFRRMPEAIRTAHMPGRQLVLKGTASVSGAENVFARMAAALFGFPQSGDGIPVTVTMRARDGKEIWVRDFGGRRFRSVLARRPDGGLSERFGPVTFDLDVPATSRGLDMLIRRWRLGPIPLPFWFAPTAEARERLDAEGRFSFDVSIALPIVGRIVRYRGWLAPEATARQAERRA